MDPIAVQSLTALRDSCVNHDFSNFLNWCASHTHILEEVHYSLMSIM